MGMEQSPRVGGVGGTVRVLSLSLSLAGSWISRDAGIVHAASVGVRVRVRDVGGRGLRAPAPFFCFRVFVFLRFRVFHVFVFCVFHVFAFLGFWGFGVLGFWICPNKGIEDYRTCYTLCKGGRNVSTTNKNC